MFEYRPEKIEISLVVSSGPKETALSAAINNQLEHCVTVSHLTAKHYNTASIPHPIMVHIGKSEERRKRGLMDQSGSCWAKIRSGV